MNAFKHQIEAEKLQQKAEGLIVSFLNKHLESGLIFRQIQKSQCWINEIFPAISDESEHDEEMISAFVAGMLHILINASDCGIRWIAAVPPDDKDNYE